MSLVKASIFSFKAEEFLISFAMQRLNFTQTKLTQPIPTNLVFPPVFTKSSKHNPTKQFQIFYEYFS